MKTGEGEITAGEGREGGKKNGEGCERGMKARKGREGGMKAREKLECVIEAMRRWMKAGEMLRAGVYRSEGWGYYGTSQAQRQMGRRATQRQIKVFVLATTF
ncbi:hypothetical protein Pmani_029119 [Petrolisthes manimaculis]|uniref:Uncharacterized protein n=1 Tax=Petrolisthes manimaculis TaxID=1843537 RepID=A0AAE1P011_9EUCA|nr:hypothetical protein Pmani_029119 [Petrolisthes manimaculis]